MSGPHSILDPAGIGGGRHTLLDPGGVFTRGGTQTNAQQVAGIQLQTSCYGKPIPLVYGTPRVAGNMVDYDDFTSTPTTTRVGKGGGGSSNTTYTYSAGAIMALCEGPITGINRVWRDQEIGTLSDYGLTMILGSRPQTPWATWTSKHPSKALPYAGIALVADASFDLGGSGTMKNHSFEVVGLLATEPDSGSMIHLGTGDGTTHNFALLDYSGNPVTDMGAYINAAYFVAGTLLTSGFSVASISGAFYLEITAAPTSGQEVAWSTTHVMADAKPAAVLVDLLTNAYHGSGWDSSRIANLTVGAQSWQAYCQAMGFAVSWAILEQKSALSHIQDLLDATNSEAVWTAGTAGMTLKVVPYGDTPITANGTTYMPNTTPLYDLGYDDFLGVVDVNGNPTGRNPVDVKRSSPGDVYNTIPVEFCDRMASYNTSSVSDPEPTDVDQNGPRTGSSATLHLITRRAHALAISRILAQRNVYVRNVYSFQVGWKYILLEPMDLVTITDARLELDHHVVRIVSIDFPDEGSEEGGMTVTAEEWPFGTGTPTLYQSQNPAPPATNTNADPGNAHAPVIFDVPALYREVGDSDEVMIATSGGSIWGGCEVWVSDDGSTYAYAGSISKAARHGVLTATLAASTTSTDTTHTCSVDLSTSGGQLQSVDAQTAIDLLNPCWVDGEVISYKDAVLTGPGQYNLTTLHRGAYGTVPGSHSGGASFVRMDETLFRYTVPPSRVGGTLYVKLVSVNLWGSGRQDLSTVPVYTYSPGSQPFPQPTNVSLTVT